MPDKTMQTTQYHCDQCRKIIGPKKHISLMVSSSYGSGIAVPPDPKKKSSEEGPKWSLMPSGIRSEFLHFCNGACIGRYFTSIIKKAK